MGEAAGHPFRGNQWTRRGRLSTLPVEQPGYDLGTEEELDSVIRYQDNSFEINPSLRKPGYYGDDDEDLIGRLDSAVSRNKVQQTELYRVVPGDIVESLVEGSTLKDKAFMSTTKTLESAQQIGQDFGGPSPHIMVIRTSPNLRGLDMNKLMAGHGVDNPFSDQDEIVLPRNLTLRVTKAASSGERKIGEWDAQRQRRRIETVTWPKVYVDIVEEGK
jgi:hypothetical protein